MKTKKNVLKKIINGMEEAMVRKCLECTNWQPVEIKFCERPECPLFPFRPKKMKGVYSIRKRVIKEKNENSEAE